MADGRRVFSTRVTPRAHQGWVLTSRAYGATATALAEAIGRELEALDAPMSKLPRHWRTLFASAAEIEREHRANQGRKKR